MAVKISDELVNRGYDKELVKRLMKDIMFIILENLSLKQNVSLGKIFTLQLCKFDPTAFAFVKRKYSFFAFTLFNQEFKRALKYQTNYLLSPDEQKHNDEVAAQIRSGHAQDGEAEEDEGSVSILETGRGGIED